MWQSQNRSVLRSVVVSQRTNKSNLVGDDQSHLVVYTSTAWLLVEHDYLDYALQIIQASAGRSDWLSFFLC